MISKKWAHTIATLLTICSVLLQRDLLGQSISGEVPRFHVKSKILTGDSPFPCQPPVDDPDSFPWPNTQIEASIAVGRNPIHRKYPMIVISYQEDRYNTSGGASAIYMIISTDGGKSFGAPIPLPTVKCFGAPFERDTNAHVGISSQGDIYICSLPFDVELDGLSTTAISKYNVRKKEFSYVKFLEDPFLDFANPPFVGTDYANLAIDPQDPKGNTAYVTWTYIQFTNPYSDSISQIRISKTTDGVNWSKPRLVYQFPQSVVDQYGGDVGAGLAGLVLLNNPKKDFSKLLALFSLGVNTDVLPPPYLQAGFPYSNKSSNQGKTWTNAIPLNNTNNTVLGQIVDPDNYNVSIRTGAGGGGAIEDRERKIIYVLNPEHSLVYDGIPTQVILYVSEDDGDTWNEIGPVNTVLAAQAFAPAISIIEEGKLAISYYDFRNHLGQPAAGSLQTDRWMDIYSYHRETKSLTLETELRLTEQSFNHRNAPETLGGVASEPGLILGDYVEQQYFQRRIYTAFPVVPQNSGPNSSHIQLSIVREISPIPGNE